jgi:hypothetical protein
VKGARRKETREAMSVEMLHLDAEQEPADVDRTCPVCSGTAMDPEDCAASFPERTAMFAESAR